MKRGLFHLISRGRIASASAAIRTKSASRGPGACRGTKASRGWGCSATRVWYLAGPTPRCRRRPGIRAGHKTAPSHKRQTHNSSTACSPAALRSRPRFTPLARMSLNLRSSGPSPIVDASRYASNRACHGRPRSPRVSPTLSDRPAFRRDTPPVLQSLPCSHPILAGRQFCSPRPAIPACTRAYPPPSRQG